MFVPRCRVRIFRNERTRSTPFGLKLMFWCISYHLGASRTIWLCYETRCKIVPSSAKVRATKSRLNFSQRTHPIHPIGPKIDILVRFVLFGCRLLGCLTKLGAKRAELVQKFMPRSRVRILHNECTRSTPLEPKLTFWFVSYYLGASGAV